eukprot:3075723-Prorocentrum_lima.AAC.1
MTSSLVGSEMCIRDRSLRIGCKQHKLKNKFRLKYEGLAAQLELQCEIQACLLYTSDAADDM